MIKKSNGFTVIELIVVVLLFLVASILFFVQKNNLQIAAQDDKRKTAINAMYYNLEEVFYPTNRYYPRTISTDNLKAVDPALFTDPNGIKLGDTGSSYSYTPNNCSGERCQGYTLKADLENEADYTKTQPK